MKALILIGLLLLCSCGKTASVSSSTSSTVLNSALYNKQWGYNNGNLYLITFTGDTATFVTRSAGHGDVYINYTITPVTDNTAVSFNGTTNSNWTYTVSEHSLNLCIDSTCYAFVN